MHVLIKIQTRALGYVDKADSVVHYSELNMLYVAHQLADWTVANGKKKD